MNNQPIWWTILKAEDFKDKAPKRKVLLENCHKCQQWFTARCELGDRPVQLRLVAGDHLAKCVEKLERQREGGKG